MNRKQYILGLVSVVIVALGIFVYIRGRKSNPPQQAAQPLPVVKTVFVRNPSTQNGAGPYGSQPDTLLIWDLTNNKQIKKIAANLSPLQDSQYQLGPDDNVYFYNTSDKQVEFVNGAGQISKLGFTAGSGDPTNSFLFSPDQTKIAWVSSDFSTAGKKTNVVSTIWSADLNGANKQQLDQKTFTGSTYLKLFRWSDRLYFSEEPNGIGDAVFGGMHNLWAYDFNSKSASKLIDPGADGLVTDLSWDNSTVAFVNGPLGKQRLNFTNLKFGPEQGYDLSLAEFKGGGDVLFSPDGRFVVYDQAHEDRANERFRTVKLQRASGEQTVILDQKTPILRLQRWVDNNTLLLEDTNGVDKYLLNLDGTNLRKIAL